MIAAAGAISSTVSPNASTRAVPLSALPVSNALPNATSSATSPNEQTPELVPTLGLMRRCHSAFFDLPDGYLIDIRGLRVFGAVVYQALLLGAGLRFR